jgi:hypothetical protein
MISIHKVRPKSIKKCVSRAIDVPGSFFWQSVKGNKGTVDEPHCPLIASAF